MELAVAVMSKALGAVKVEQSRNVSSTSINECTKDFFQVLPKLRPYFHVRLIDGAARIFSYILNRDREQTHDS